MTEEAPRPPEPARIAFYDFVKIRLLAVGIGSPGELARKISSDPKEIPTETESRNASNWFNGETVPRPRSRERLRQALAIVEDTDLHREWTTLWEAAWKENYANRQKRPRETDLSDPEEPIGPNPAGLAVLEMPSVAAAGIPQPIDRPSSVSAPSLFRSVGGVSIGVIENPQPQQVVVRPSVSLPEPDASREGTIAEPLAPNPPRASLPVRLLEAIDLHKMTLSIAALAVAAGAVTYMSRNATSSPPVRSPRLTLPYDQMRIGQDGFIFADSDKRLLSKDEISRLNGWELFLARNEIFARHDYIPTFRCLAVHFNKFAKKSDGNGWYTPVAGIKFDSLNVVEAENVTNINIEEHNIRFVPYNCKDN